MIPFLGMGTDQLANNSVGEPATGDREKFCGSDGTAKWKGNNNTSWYIIWHKSTRNKIIGLVLHTFGKYCTQKSIQIIATIQTRVWQL